jgi:hypothetical protein
MEQDEAEEEQAADGAAAGGAAADGGASATQNGAAAAANPDDLWAAAVAASASGGQQPAAQPAATTAAAAEPADATPPPLAAGEADAAEDAAASNWAAAVAASRAAPAAPPPPPAADVVGVAPATLGTHGAEAAVPEQRAEAPDSVADGPTPAPGAAGVPPHMAAMYLICELRRSQVSSQVAIVNHDTSHVPTSCPIHPTMNSIDSSLQGSQGRLHRLSATCRSLEPTTRRRGNEGRIACGRRSWL